MSLDLSSELDIAEQLARCAGQMALDFQHDLTVGIKPNNEGPVTNADIAVDQYITKELRRYFPNDSIISEEGFNLSNFLVGAGRTWFVDPIDGTSNYLTQGRDFAVMIGLAIDGIARLGVVYQPATQTLWRGIFCKDFAKAEKIDDKDVRSLMLTPIPKLPDELTILASRSHKSPRQDAMIKALHPRQVLYQGSVGLKAMMVVEQLADLYVAWSRHIKKWDTCAPAAIAKAAGAHIYHIDLDDLDYLGPISHQKPIMIASFAPDKTLLATLATIADERPS